MAPGGWVTSGQRSAVSDRQTAGGNGPAATPYYSAAPPPIAIAHWSLPAPSRPSPCPLPCAGEGSFAIEGGVGRAGAGGCPAADAAATPSEARRRGLVVGVGWARAAVGEGAAREALAARVGRALGAGPASPNPQSKIEQQGRYPPGR